MGGSYFPQFSSYNLQLLGFEQLCPAGLWQHPSSQPWTRGWKKEACRLSHAGWRDEKRKSIAARVNRTCKEKHREPEWIQEQGVLGGRLTGAESFSAVAFVHNDQGCERQVRVLI